MFNTCYVLVDGPKESQTLRRVITALKGIGCTNVTLGDSRRGVDFGVGEVDIIVVMAPGNGLERIHDFRVLTANCFVPLVVVLDNDDAQARSLAFRRGAHDVIGMAAVDDELRFRLRNALESRACFRKLLEERNRLEDEIARSNAQLEETRLEITRRLGRAAEYRDNETGHHVVRVSSVSQIIASALGLSLREVELVAQASPLHDIGKIGIPDSILLKPGKLSEIEWRIMKRHTVIGARILSGSDDPIMLTAREIALTHHEHWGGGGYPRHLSGARIPIVGRIVAVCDVFDALTSRRPYKAPWGYDEAFEYIRSQAGSQFDPKVVGAFNEARVEIAEVAKRYAEPENGGAKIFRYAFPASGELRATQESPPAYPRLAFDALRPEYD